MSINTVINVERLSHQVSAMRERCLQLISRAGHSAGPATEIVSSAVKELSVATEELQVTLEELERQNEELTIALEVVRLERQRYQELFEFSPEAHLVTDLDGVIREANLAAGQLLGVAAKFLVGKPLFLYVHSSDRHRFRFKLAHQRHAYSEHWELKLLLRDQEVVDVECLTSLVCSSGAQPVSIRWLLKDIRDRKRLVGVPQSSPSCLEDELLMLLQDRSPQVFHRSEVIPLDRVGFWVVRQGVVKLTTLAEGGEEILTGLACPGMPIGSCFTGLPVYQCTALTQVQLLPLLFNEVATSTELTQLLFAKTCQRLKQTEAFLSVSGQRRVRDRLLQLLELLRNEVGQPVSQGIRIGVRLTHEELANACCTTRVTVTRLLGELQQAGRIAVDKQNHLILLNLEQLQEESAQSYPLSQERNFCN
jgi:PAS domain S-box-containing protein